MTRRNRLALVAACAALVAAGAATAVHLRAPTPGGAAATRQAPDAARGPCSLPPGSRTAFRVTTTSDVSIDLSPLVDDARLGPGVRADATALDRRSRRGWRVDIQGLRVEDDGAAVVAARIDAGPIEMLEGQPEAPPRPGLDEPFLVRLGADCSIRAFAWRGDGDLEAAREQQRLVAALDFAAPVAGERSYTRPALDPIGRYQAHYSVGPSGVVTGRALEFTNTFVAVRAGAESPTLRVDDSAIEVELAAGAWFDNLRTRRTASLAVGDKVVGRLSSTVAAERADPTWGAPPALDDNWTWGLLLDRPAAGSPSRPDRGGDSAAARVPWTGARDAYLAAATERGTAIDAVPALVEWLRANPDGAAELIASLRAGAFADDARAEAGVFLALAMANTPGCRDALVTVLDGGDFSARHRVGAAGALATIESPTAEMADALVRGARAAELDSMARGSIAMALGTFAEHNAAGAPELADRATDAIAAWLEAPADDGELAATLLAAGNAGSDALVDSIAPYFAHGDAQIRERSQHALRHMSPEVAFPRLERGAGDDDPAVRATALEAAVAVGARHDVAPPDSLVNAAIDRLADGSDRREEGALVGLLGLAARRGDPAARRALDQQLEDERAAAVRDSGRLRLLGRAAPVRWTAP